MSRNNNRNYLEPSNLVSVYVSFVKPMINVWQLFTLSLKNLRGGQNDPISFFWNNSRKRQDFATKF